MMNVNSQAYNLAYFQTSARKASRLFELMEWLSSRCVCGEKNKQVTKLSV